MGVDVALMRVDQLGTSPKRRRVSLIDAVVDGADRFARLCTDSGLPMLNTVDPYGSLILTRADMEQFIAEVEVVRARVDDSSGRTLLEDVLRLARICSTEPSTELHIDGD
ncbi:hypothetical protein [Streptomyces acidicola]|uniref:Uncharacterized protein n=1 Tax=Streptomyces acidicola TaxID=2596892 RepID=A0A5N8X225_9ACTN|nr:hypothetical protein [Streptomyces acidicola]MPY53086.1 hypothetical protein [Streptomyces acidicola]